MSERTGNIRLTDWEAPGITEAQRERLRAAREKITKGVTEGVVTMAKEAEKPTDAPSPDGIFNCHTLTEEDGYHGA